MTEAEMQMEGHGLALELIFLEQGVKLDRFRGKGVKARIKAVHARLKAMCDELIRRDEKAEKGGA